MIQLSILIPSIPTRFNKAKALYDKILSMVGDKQIEILMLTDNKKRTIGEKREALKNVMQLSKKVTKPTYSICTTSKRISIK